MEQTEDDSETEDLEEGLEDVGGGQATEGEGEEGGDTSVSDSSSYEGDSPAGSLLSAPLGPQEGVSNVDSVVNTQTDGQHDVDGGQDVDCEAPEVHEPNNVHQCHDDN